MEENQKKNGRIKMIWNFIRYGKCKGLCLRTLFLSAYYRVRILMLKPAALHKTWGKRGEESPETESEDAYRYAGKVGYAVDMVCSRTRWESKCLVRALCAQHFLKAKGISSTLYLGCGTQEGQMSAHAWLRCGRMYVTGGDGEGYAIVDKYAK